MVLFHGPRELVSSHRAVLPGPSRSLWDLVPVRRGRQDLSQKRVGIQGDTSYHREWAAMANSFLGKYKTPTLRNVDKRPRPDFVKAYMDNGYLKSLKEAVHFYNTRDALPTCKPGDRGEKVTCWPATETPETTNRKQIGNLKLTDKQEDLLVTFLKTLTDGYRPPDR